jgi:hypothetical protein
MRRRSGVQTLYELVRSSMRGANRGCVWWKPARCISVPGGEIEQRPAASLSCRAERII